MKLRNVKEKNVIFTMGITVIIKGKKHSIFPVALFNNLKDNIYCFFIPTKLIK